jgi:hypothetical protein
MLITRILRLKASFDELDNQIDKFRGLAKEFENANRSYYGEYLSSMLYDEDE